MPIPQKFSIRENNSKPELNKISKSGQLLVAEIIGNIHTVINSGKNSYRQLLSLNLSQSWINLKNSFNLPQRGFSRKILLRRRKNCG